MTKKISNKNKKNKQIQQIFGLHSVTAALENPKRKHLELLILKKYKFFLQKYKKKVSKIRILNKREMINLFGNESVNQGIVLKSLVLNQINFNDFFNLEKKQDKSIIIALDQVTDPQNIGAIIRSCAVFNCRAIIVSKDNSPEITSAVIKSASGAAEIINYISVVNLKRALSNMKRDGYWVYGFDNSTQNKLEENKISKKSVFVFGSEGKGMRDLIKKECDQIVSIHQKQNIKYGIDSLNVSNATSIALYEYFKKFN